MPAKTVALITTLALLKMITPAYAGTVTCMGLLQACEAEKKSVDEGNTSLTGSTDWLSAGLCLGYVTGFEDARALSSSKSYCPPESSTVAQLGLVFVEWAQHYPEKLHFPAELCFSVAMNAALPCPSKQ